MKQQRYTDEFRREAIRHSCLTRWAPHMAPYTLGYLAGHSDMNVTKRYIHPDDETVKAAFDRAKNLPNLPARSLSGIRGLQPRINNLQTRDGS